MPKEPQVRLTKFELEVMDALWALGSASVREVQERLPAAKRPAYTTVQTIIYRLEEKGAVRRVKKIGNAHVFEPLVTRKAAARRLVDELLAFFGGNPASLMAQLVEAGRLTLEDLREAEGALEQIEAERAAASRAEKDEKSAGRTPSGASRGKRKR